MFAPSLSYWEIKSWLSKLDFVIIGSGIVGLNAALSLRQKFPKSKILILEKGFLPAGASTKNAGFSCFGSISEIVDDLNHHAQEEVFELVKKRFDGIALLRENLGDRAIGFKNFGGYEFFESQDQNTLDKCMHHEKEINQLLHRIFGENPFKKTKNTFGFKKVIDVGYVNRYESQINTGQMMQALLRKVQKSNILQLNGVGVLQLEDNGREVLIGTDQKFSLKAPTVLVATNGFAAELMDLDVKPARAQVLITKPVKNLPLKGTFHLDRGYYYFRNVGNRLLLGGGRNLDFQTEETYDLSLTQKVQNKLDTLISEMILPGKIVEIEHRWSGIMGVGGQKKPIVKWVSPRIGCAVRMGGMGVALGSKTGKELAELTNT
ncbi:MAG: FAD-binding oxidoreductase [Bacteroidetes bacterium]|nr:FAD-binding oxidoreductase [Bacteroidota bacterium]